MFYKTKRICSQHIGEKEWHEQERNECVFLQ